MKLILIFEFIFISVNVLISQQSEVNTLKNWQLKGYGKSAERQGDLYSAIDFYSEYVKRNPNDLSYVEKLAGLYFKAKNYENAEKLYSRLFEHEPAKYRTALYYLGEVLKSEAKYDSAQIYFLKFRDLIANDKNRTLYSYLVNVEIESCDFALNKAYYFDNLVINHLDSSINKIHLESAPLIYDDSTLIYSSFNTDSLPVISNDKETNFPVSKFYTAQLKGNNWHGANAAPEPFYNFENQNTANGVFSLDKQRFYFTSATRNWKNKIIGTLYVSQKRNGIWQKPVKLDKKINLKGFTSTQPAIGTCYEKNYEVIYFISDRPDGWGGMDIWFTVYDIYTNSYKTPVNAGGYINTPADEITPFYDSNNQILYFSSNGLPGYGGFDIYTSKGSLVNWNQARNAGMPLNSRFDDIYYCKFNDKENGFLVSNRDGALTFKNPHCCYDIFEFSITENRLKTDTTESPVFAKNEIRDHSNSIVGKLQQTIDSTMISFEQLQNTDKEKTLNHNNLNVADKSNNPSGGIKTLKTEKANKSDFLKKPANSSVALGNIYFEFNKSELTRESKEFLDTTLVLVMKQYSTIIVEIGAHTDHIGSDIYNLELSQKRAESVVKYLIDKGIGANRLVPLGYGKRNPIVNSIDSNGKDIPEAREKNRRIEFKILGLIHKGKQD